MKTIVNVRIALFAFVFLFSASIARAQNSPPQPVEKLTVVDSNGKLVGNVLGYGNQFVGLPASFGVALRVQDKLLLVSVSKLLFVGTGLGTWSPVVFFESTDCSGTRYVRQVEIQEDEGIVTPLSIVAENKVYSLDGSPTTLHLHSLLSINVFPWQWGCVPDIDEEWEVTALREVTDLNNFFTPPFSIK